MCAHQYLAYDRRLQSDDVVARSRQMLIIKLYSEWERFFADLLEASSHRKPLTANSVRVQNAPGIRTKREFDAAVSRLYSRSPNRPFTPSWGIAKHVVKIANGVGLQNAPTIVNAVGSQSSPADQLRLIRNFYAHRNESTAQQVWRIPPPAPSLGSLDSWLEMIVLPTMPRILLWADELSDIATAAVQ